MNVSLTPELEEFVNKKVDSGRYHSSSEVVRAGLRLLQEQDELHQMKLETLRRELTRGIEQLDKGEGISGKRVFAEIKRRNQALRRKK
ncbi:MAG TPA: type II toxin-antitoxin system ParD family antitoxin [Blastocatellia bacterium]|nr:type II toxin-antitoxin system ParD family antitoxin [Blastocatellia bacterium]